MSARTTTEKRLLCPSCGRKGKRVGRVTLRALLKDEFADEITPREQSGCDTKGDGASGCKPVSGDTGWRFCDSPDCDVVYFAEENDALFGHTHLQVAVGVKQKTGDRPLCYCFGHSVANIKEELRMKGQSHAVDDIRRKMKDPGCRCEVTNPSGSCCLGSVAKGIETAKQELVSAESDKVPPPRISTTNRGEKIAKIGTVISAIVASSCCWLPLLAVGVSGAGIAASLQSYRPTFIVVTFGFLTAAFYFTYQPRKSIPSGEDAYCGPEAIEATEDCCAPAGKRRLSMMTMNKVMLWVVTLLAVAFLFFPHYVGLLLGTGERTPVTANVNRDALMIERMTCDGCAAIAAKAIRSVPGVLAVEVDYRKGQAVIATEPCGPVPREQILAALEKVGYAASFVTSSE